jgi:hypothetical protein
MTRILAPLVVGYLNNNNIAQLHDPFGFQSDELKKHGLKDEVWAQTGFVFDFESIPNLIRGPVGENKRGGASHDILSRKNVCPGITQGIAADVYFEIMEYCDSIDTQRFAEEKHPYLPTGVIVPYVKTRDWLRRWTKSTVVRYWPGGFWQKYKMTATSEEIYGLGGDPYITAEKLAAIIEKQEQVTADIKDVQVEQKADLVDASEKVTEDLKDVKADVVAKTEMPAGDLK